ncbi:MAG: YheV family putative metal-binding protein [Alcanivorax sp.]|nr:YheV family putative metal-binding protein [Alcanivorax sp.]
MAVKRQFIAGAACPSCGALDRVQRCLDGERIWMECVACGMVRDLDQQPAAVDANEQPVALRGPKSR